MDFTALIKKSFSLAWNNRVLWLFGLLSGGMGAVGSYGGGFPNFSFSNSQRSSSVSPNKIYEEASHKVTGYVNSISPQTWLTLFLILAVVVVLIVLVGIFISSWASSALVYSTLNMHNERPTFKKGVKAGLKYWWKFYLLTLTFGLAILTFILLLALPLLFLYLAKLQTLMAIYFVFGLIIFVITIFIVSVFSSLLMLLSQRLIIHRGLGVMESIRVAGGLVKKHLGETLLTYFLAVALNFGAGFAMLIAVIPIALVLIVLFFINPLLILAAAVPAILLFLVIGGFLQAYRGVYWTLFYQHLASKEGW